MNLPWKSQVELANAVCRRADVYRELAGVLSPRCFGMNQALGWIVEGAVACWQEYGAPPTEGVLRDWLTHRIDGILLATALERLPDVLAAETPPASWAVVTGRRAAAVAHLEILNGSLTAWAEEGRFDTILSEARKAALLACPGGELTTGTPSEEGVRARQTEVSIRMATGIKGLDALLLGGLKKGEMGHVLGKKGGGKSHTLVSFTGKALALGARVLYASLEMSEPEVRARVDRNLLGLSGVRFLERLPQEFLRLQEAHSRLSVLIRKGLSVRTLTSAIERLEHPPDVVIVDYLQLIAGEVEGTGEVQAMRRLSLGRTSQELHDLAQEKGMALWSAYQANRLGIQKMRSTLDGSGILDVTDYAEAIDAAWPAAVVVSINQSILEAAAGKGRLFLAENRGGPSLRTVPVVVDWATSTVRDA